MPEQRPLRLVCLGDSFTEGLFDDLRPDGEYLGWADRVADALAANEGGRIDFANLAVRGKLLDQIVEIQIPRALGLDPDILTFHAGGNDVLRRGTDLPDLFARYDESVARIVRPGRQVLLFTCITRTGGTGRLADAIADRLEAFNRNVRETARRHGTQIVDLDSAETLGDRQLWHTDRLHLNAAGHSRVAAAVLEELGIDDQQLIGGPPGWWRQPLPQTTKPGRRDALLADVAWIRDHFGPWIWRRIRGVSSGDGRVAKDDRLRAVATTRSR